MGFSPPTWASQPSRVSSIEVIARLVTASLTDALHDQTVQQFGQKRKHTVEVRDVDNTAI